MRKTLGYILATPQSLIGGLLLFWYRPKNLRWRDGCLEGISRTTLIGGKWVGAQTHGWIIFFRDTESQERGDLSVHERVHVTQAFTWGPLYPIAYGLHWLWLFLFRKMDWKTAYRNIVFERTAYATQAEYKQTEKMLKPSFWGHR